MYDVEQVSCFYVPEKDVILYGSLSKQRYSLTDQAEFLEEARVIANGVLPKIEGVEFKNIKNFEYDGSRLQGLIEDIRSRNELDKKAKCGIEELLTKIE